MPQVRLGHHDGKVTTVVIPDSRTEDEAIRDIMDVDGVWNAHRGYSDSHVPAWVESDSQGLAEAISKTYNCRIGE